MKRVFEKTLGLISSLTLLDKSPVLSTFTLFIRNCQVLIGRKGTISFYDLLLYSICYVIS